MGLILIIIIVVLLVCLMYLYLKYKECEKQLLLSIKEYKHIREDYNELLRDLRDEKNKNFLLQSVINKRK
jgi:uncharacterized membrane protein YukC